MSGRRPAVSDGVLLMLMLVALAVVVVWLLWGVEQHLVQQIGNALNGVTTGEGG